MPTSSKKMPDGFVLSIPPWYSISATTAYDPDKQPVAKQTVTLHLHKCAGCLRKFKTMRQTQSYCSTACFALQAHQRSAPQTLGKQEQVEVSIIGPASKKHWRVDRRRKSLSDIRDIQEVLTDDEV